MRQKQNRAVYDANNNRESKAKSILKKRKKKTAQANWTAVRNGTRNTGMIRKGN